MLCALSVLVVVVNTVRAADLATADILYAEGQFAAAEEIYRDLLQKKPDDSALLRKTGMIALWGNRLGEAVVLLGDALEADPGNSDTALLLAEAEARRLNFASAARLLRRGGREVPAAQLASFSGQTPYATADSFRQTEIRFTRTDPLPVIQMRINGSEPTHFLIDTGGSELVLDPEFAEQVGAEVFGAESSTFAAGQKAEVQVGRVDSVSVGTLTVRNVPVDLLPTKRFSAAAGGTRIDGIVGTILLSQFQFTLDYPNGQLILRRRRATPPEGGVQMPFWMAGDHFMVAWGQVNDSEPVLLLMDTGLAGGGFVGPDSILSEAGIDVGGESFEGVGGAGAVKVTPFVVEQLALGKAVAKNVTGFAGVFPPELEHRFGFRIAGLVSHQFFRPYAVTFDFDSMTLTLHK